MQIPPDSTVVVTTSEYLGQYFEGALRSMSDVTCRSYIGTVLYGTHRAGQGES